MVAILIIVSIVALIFIIRAVNTTNRKKETKSDLQNLFEKMREEIFPNGQKDIDEGIKELLRILNYSIDEKTAQNIFIKSSSICYTTSSNGEFNIERLKQHLSPYALHYFDEKALAVFYEYLLSKNGRAQDWINISREYSKSVNPSGTDADEMPEGYGEFGLQITNPIPTSSIPDSRLYLNRLRTKDGNEITFDRIGSMRTQNIKHIIDGYKIYVNRMQIATIYICPYNRKTSTKAPKGFKLI